MPLTTTVLIDITFHKAEKSQQVIVEMFEGNAKEIRFWEMRQALDLVLMTGINVNI